MLSMLVARIDTCPSKSSVRDTLEPGQWRVRIGGFLSESLRIDAREGLSDGHTNGLFDVVREGDASVCRGPAQ